MKTLLFLLLFFSLILVPSALLLWLPTETHTQANTYHSTQKKVAERNASFLRLQGKAFAAKRFVLQNGLSFRYAFLIDMRLPSGQKRFFVYDLKKDSVLASGLVAHGSCNKRFLETAAFSNVPGCGCSAIGKYKVGGMYEGGFGKAFKLHGLDSSNSNAYERNIVLHAYGCVSDNECYPYPICNSLGCTMVSYKFLNTLAAFIAKERKPILLWLYE